MGKVIVYLLVLLILFSVANVTALDIDPKFIIGQGSTAALNMELTQDIDDDPTDLVYYIEAPVIINITYANDGSPVDGATVRIVGDNIDYTGTTNASGIVTYTFNITEMPEPGHKTSITVSKSGYNSVDEDIYIGYKGILGVKESSSGTDITDASPVTGTIDIDVTIVDISKNVSGSNPPVEGVNITNVITNTNEITTLTWSTPQSQTTNSSGRVTFRINIKATSGTHSESNPVRIEMAITGLKPGYSTATTNLDIRILSSTGACFIATAAYGSPTNENLDTLRSFRDSVLMTNPVGRTLVKTYYATSPPIAYSLSESDGLRAATRSLLITPLLYFAIICLNPLALIGISAGAALTLFILRKNKPALKGIGYGGLTILAFIGSIFLFGYLGYSMPIFATIGAYILPMVFPVAIGVLILTILMNSERFFASVFDGA
ncbi:MAG: CFI-box-CTERM domain-containing protein [Halobacteriota archaeon]|nr:CFI-box-CTERM domain-containing protein [Halobacteriota archaeon]